MGTNGGEVQKRFWLIPVLLAIVVNANVLANGFGWDDESIIPKLSDSKTLLSAFLPNDPSAPGPGGAGGHYYRPVIAVSYLLDFKLWGKEAFGYHFSVWLAHIINTVLVYILARRLNGSTVRRAFLLPVIAASLFAVHPIHAEAIAWIAGRNDVFCTTFILGSMILYIRFNQTRGWGAYTFSMMLFLAALLTKEIAVGLVVLFPLYDYLIGREEAGNRRRMILRGILPVGILAVYFIQRTALIYRPLGVMSGEDIGLNLASGSSIFKLIIAFGAYFKMLIFPYPHNPFIAALPNSGLFLVLSGLAFLGVIVGLIIVIRQGQVVPGMAGAWTLLILLPSLMVAVLDMAASPVAERYVYAPSAGFLILVAWLIYKGLDRFEVFSSLNFRLAGRVLGIAGIILLVILSWESWGRNAVWKNSVNFWQTAVRAPAGGAFARRELAKHYVRMGRYSEAEQLYQMAIEMDELNLGPDHPDVAQSLNNLGVIYFKQGNNEKAEPLHLRALTIREKALNPNHRDIGSSLNNLAIIYDMQDRYGEAEPLYRRAISVWEAALGEGHPEVAKGLHNLAVLYRKEARYVEAEPLYRRALSVWEKALGPNHPNRAMTMESYAAMLQMAGRDSEAAEWQKRAEDIRRGISP